MLNDVTGDVRERVLQFFPERQIYLRSGGEVRYHTLTTRVQVSVVGAAAFLALWFLLTLLNMAFGFNLLTSKSDEVKRVEARYERLLADSQAKEENAKLLLSEQRESFEAMATNLETKHQTLSAIISTDLLPKSDPAANATYADARIVMSPSMRDADERTALRSTIGSRDIATGLPLDNSLSALDDTQNAILMKAEVGLLDTIDRNRAPMQEAVLDIDAVLANGDDGKGGPFIPLTTTETIAKGEFLPRAQAIQARLSEAERLEAAVQGLPFGHPVKNETVMTSDFGVRTDPINKRPTFHGGHDYIGGTMAPIVATAPGIVRFSGRKGTYGRMVEIDHGHGFITRYAHLKKAFVKRGQTVEKGQEIGGMGNTGRSTATHLHYEVRFEGRAVDPATFLKAGRYVQ